jgi:hypothetical protein
LRVARRLRAIDIGVDPRLMGPDAASVAGLMPSFIYLNEKLA